MDVTINGNRSPASQSSDGRYYKTFTPQTPQDRIQIHPLDGCIGDTKLIEIQLEKGNTITRFIEPKVTVSPLSGILKDLRNLNLEIKNPGSELWGKIRTSNEGMMKEYFSKAAQSIVAQTAHQISTEIRDVKNNLSQLTQKANTIEASVNTANSRSVVNVDSNGIRLGSGTVIDGEKLASMFNVSSRAIELISSQIRARGDLMVDGSITGRKVAANTITGGNIAGGTITGQHIQSNSIEAKHLKVDYAMAQKLLADDAVIRNLTAKQAFINSVQAIKITSKQVSTDLLSGYLGKIGGFNIGVHPAGWGNWITGTNSFAVGMSDGSQQGTALWVNWGNRWDAVGAQSWYVKSDGVMHCNNKAYCYGGLAAYKYFESNGYATFYDGLEMKNKNIVMNYNNIEGNSQHGKTYVVWWSERAQFVADSSDIRLKTNIETATVNSTKLIQKMQFKQYDWKKDSKHEELGLIAQEVQELLPEAIVEGEHLKINYLKLVPYALKAIQELTEQVESLEKRLQHE